MSSHERKSMTRHGVDHQIGIFAPQVTRNRISIGLKGPRNLNNPPLGASYISPSYWEEKPQEPKIEQNDSSESIDAISVDLKQLLNPNKWKKLSQNLSTEDRERLKTILETLFMRHEDKRRVLAELLETSEELEQGRIIGRFTNLTEAREKRKGKKQISSMGFSFKDLNRSQKRALDLQEELSELKNDIRTLIEIILTSYPSVMTQLQGLNSKIH